MKVAISEMHEQLLKDGFTIVRYVYSAGEAEQLIQTIEQYKPNQKGRGRELYAIRNLLREVPELARLVFTPGLKKILNELVGTDCFVIKSIFFDKPETSNWFVPYHQDLAITVNEKAELEGFTSWTVKDNNIGVIPPVKILYNNVALRIHLDDTDEENGALRVIPGSHLKGIYRPESMASAAENEVVCKVPKGGVMLMKPLLLHASRKSTNGKQRRVIHVEFGIDFLPEPLRWAEYMQVPHASEI